MDDFTHKRHNLTTKEESSGTGHQTGLVPGLHRTKTEVTVEIRSESYKILDHMLAPSSTPFRTPTRRAGCKTPKTPTTGDRFIPNRGSVEWAESHFRLLNSAENTPTAPNQPPARILSFSAPKQPATPSPLAKVRLVPKSPERILDAPDLLDDYYLNLLDWSSRDQVAVALSKTVYLWKGDAVALCSTAETDCVTSVSYDNDGRYLAVGTHSQHVQIFDVDRQHLVRTMAGHSGRVSSLSWNGPICTSGSKDGSILLHDVRQPDHIVRELEGHQQEVCGVRWSSDGLHLASGANDNVLCVWDARSEQPLHRLTAHTAAVKALAWSPHTASLLASGGGTADRHIRLWDVSTGACLNSIDTKSQVCALQWSRTRKELYSSHGFSENQIVLWAYPTMSKIAELTGHSNRVLHMAQSPDGNTLVTAAADETMRFWRLSSADSKSQQGQRGYESKLAKPPIFIR